MGHHAGGCVEPRELRGAGPPVPAPALHGGGCCPPRAGSAAVSIHPRFRFAGGGRNSFLEGIRGRGKKKKKGNPKEKAVCSRCSPGKRALTHAGQCASRGGRSPAHDGPPNIPAAGGIPISKTGDESIAATEPGRRRDVAPGHETPADVAGGRRRREPGGDGGRAAVPPPSGPRERGASPQPRRTAASPHS